MRNTRCKGSEDAKIRSERGSLVGLSFASSENLRDRRSGRSPRVWLHNEKRARGGVVAKPQAPVAAVDCKGCVPLPSQLRCAWKAHP